MITETERSSDLRAGGEGTSTSRIYELLNYPSGLPYSWHYLAKGYSLLIPNPLGQETKEPVECPTLSLYLQVNKK